MPYLLTPFCLRFVIGPMQTLPLALLAGLALSGLACDSVSRITASSSWQSPMTPLAPTVPHRCNVCNGTGSVTQSAQVPLPSTVTHCELDRTGFLGLGSDRIAVMAIRNDGDEGGTFVFKIRGRYPGGGAIDHGQTDAYVAAHRAVTQRIRFSPQDGLQDVLCEGVPPVVVQQHQVICPVCNGRGMVQ